MNNTGESGQSAPGLNIDHTLKAFNELNVDELYSLLKLRSDVFILEQNCVYPDIDDKDRLSIHLQIFANDKLVAYARLLPAGVSYPEVSIGRVVSSSSVRGKGIGSLLMKEAIRGCFQYFGASDIRISAQYYLLEYYRSFGFLPQGAPYMEDGIMHIEMLRKATLGCK
ncbi:GNAT family N-acetyltransferase [Pedobacter deserti]|uniref:GNAT family N-acetyltransferase n=1 Tax=Pedobacter deserti TaxID=2817382 RepID=UPI00210DC4BC|nr:GNAT family N-acetyltransferase [Pedobacter sp. SYSU D00382]